MSTILSRITSPGVRLCRREARLLVPGSVRSICHKDHIDPEILRDKPAPFPYDRYKFGYWQRYLLRLDRAVRRFDENSVVICVEGLMGVGKHEFASQLSDLLGMRYYGMPDTEPLMVHDNGFDYRTLNWLLPEAAQYTDLKLFYLNPVHGGVPGFILNMYNMKFFHALEALTHLFNTGQGVVHEGSFWSDFVFHKALIGMGLMGKDVADHYYDKFTDMRQTIHRPHVVIYLDIPAEEALRRFKAKSPDYIRDSPVVNLEYFQRMEDLYKNTYLPDITKHAEVLIYDWREGGDMEMVVEDLETLDMGRHDRMTEKWEDWRHYKEEEFDQDRYIFTSCRDECWGWGFQPVYDKPSVIMSIDAARHHRHVLETHGPKYSNMWDPKQKGIMKLMFALRPLHPRLEWEMKYFGTSMRDKWTSLRYF